MSQPVREDRIAKFYQDRSLLPYNDGEIGNKMGVNKSNYSSYVNGRYPITNIFLRKFYAVFGEELNKISIPEVRAIQEETSPQTELGLLKSIDSKLTALLEAIYNKQTQCL